MLLITVVLPLANLKPPEKRPGKIDTGSGWILTAFSSNYWSPAQSVRRSCTMRGTARGNQRCASTWGVCYRRQQRGIIQPGVCGDGGPTARSEDRQAICSSREVLPLIHIKRSGLKLIPCYIQNAHPIISPISSKQRHVFARGLRRLTAGSRATHDMGIVVKQHQDSCYEG